MEDCRDRNDASGYGGDGEKGGATTLRSVTLDDKNPVFTVGVVACFAFFLLGCSSF